MAFGVSGQGPGIAPEHHDRIFARFYRADKDCSRKMGRTGLGLAIVKHIVQGHQGRLELESQPGRGSAFRIILAGRHLERMGDGATNIAEAVVYIIQGTIIRHRPNCGSVG